MNDRDPLLLRLAELPVAGLDPGLSSRIRAQAEQRLVPRRLALGWTVALTLSVASYLYWALAFTSSLVAAR
jgi:hypothetical protein